MFPCSWWGETHRAPSTESSHEGPVCLSSCWRDQVLKVLTLVPPCKYLNKHSSFQAIHSGHILLWENWGPRGGLTTRGQCPTNLHLDCWAPSESTTAVEEVVRIELHPLSHQTPHGFKTGPLSTPNTKRKFLQLPRYKTKLWWHGKRNMGCALTAAFVSRSGRQISKHGSMNCQHSWVLTLLTLTKSWYCSHSRNATGRRNFSIILGLCKICTFPYKEKQRPKWTSLIMLFLILKTPYISNFIVDPICFPKE